MKLSVKEMAVFSMLGTMMYASKIIMEAMPNVHLLGVFVIAFTVVYRKKALYPIYIFVFLTGIFSGFATWWIPYLYIWAVLWAVTMLIPQWLPVKVKPVVYMVISALHGYMYGILYAPAQALLFGLDYNGMIAWIIAGLPFDIIHGTSNLFCGLLIQPLIKTLETAEKASKHH